MTPHWLAPMLEPKSVALVGASPKIGSVGQQMLEHLHGILFEGDVHLVNPKYDAIDGQECHTSLRTLTAPPDLAIMGVGGANLESAFIDAAAIGAKGVVIFADCYLDGDQDPPLVERLRHLAHDAGMAVCGGNGLGFFNFESKTMATFSTPANANNDPGTVTLIAHSGSVVTALTMHRPVNIYNLVVSPGQEINGTVADYMNYALTLPSTKVLALFIEAVREPGAFIEALRHAQEKNVPVVALKTGRTDESARLSVSHTGALSGRDEAFDAVLRRHGAIRVATVDELEATAMILAQGREPGAGGLAATLDSGGLRALMIDRAEALGVPLAAISDQTRDRLRQCLRHGMEPVNPLDAWAERRDVSKTFRHCFAALADDENTAMVGHFFEMRDRLPYAPFFESMAVDALSQTKKPVFVASSYAGVRNDDIAARLIAQGVPVINGIDTALAAAHNALTFRDSRARRMAPPHASPPEALVSRWRSALGSGGACAKPEELLTDFTVPVTTVVVADDIDGVRRAVDQLGYPVVMKTAMAGVNHKSDVGGVAIDLGNDEDVIAAYAHLQSTLGPRVSISPMVAPGPEFAFGAIHDEQYGPIVMVSAGGTLVELFDDRIWAVPPFDGAEAERLIRQLKAARLLDGVRGNKPADAAALSTAFSNFSVMVAALSGAIEEVDINPIIVGPTGCVAVDALIAGRRIDLE